MSEIKIGSRVKTLHEFFCGGGKVGTVRDRFDEGWLVEIDNERNPSRLDGFYWGYEDELEVIEEDKTIIVPMEQVLNGNVCPEMFGLKEDCELDCKECWEKAVGGECKFDLTLVKPAEQPEPVEDEVIKVVEEPVEKMVFSLRKYIECRAYKKEISKLVSYITSWGNRSDGMTPIEAGILVNDDWLTPESEHQPLLLETASEIAQYIIDNYYERKSQPSDSLESEIEEKIKPVSMKVRCVESDYEGFIAGNIYTLDDRGYFTDAENGIRFNHADFEFGESIFNMHSVTFEPYNEPRKVKVGDKVKVLGQVGKYELEESMISKVVTVTHVYESYDENGEIAVDGREFGRTDRYSLYKGEYELI